MDGGSMGGVRAALSSMSPASARSTIERGARYLRTYWWLWQQQAIAGRRLFLLAVFFGLVSRFGHLIVLVVSMKCALWLLRPNTLPAAMTGVLPGGADSPLVVPILFSMPATVMFGALLTQHLHTRFADRHKSEFAFQLAFRSIEGRFAEGIPSAEAKRRQLLAAAGGLARQFERLLARLVRVEANVLSIIIQSASLIMAMLLGLYLDPIVTAVMLSMGLIAAIVFVSLRHGHFQRLMKEREALQREQVEARKSLLEGLADRLSAPHDSDALKEVASSYDRVARGRRMKEVGFRTVSNLLISAGQAVLILGLLLAIYLRGAPKDAHEIAMAIVLLLVLRGALGLIRGISVSAVALSRDYVMLVELAEGRAVSETTEGGDADLMDREEQDI
ncbi:MAG: hypothetical protein R3D57_00285 [Hyphomicrobiaceae bacterium]